MQRVALCPCCGHSFGSRDVSTGSHAHGGRLPLLLQCGHTACEGCLNKLTHKQQNLVKCPICQIPMPLREDGVRGLPVDTYVLGMLTISKKSTIDRLKSSVQFQLAGSTNSSSAKKEVAKREMCAECGNKAATCRCEKCDGNMCGTCFDLVHKVSKSLRKHQASPLVDAYTSSVFPSTCSKHDNRLIEYYCDEDETPICSHCVVMGDHKGHAITAMEEKNKNALIDIEPALEQSNIVLRRMRLSEKVLNAAVPKVKSGLQQIMDEISLQFRYAHGILQAREAELLEELAVKYGTEGSPLEDMRTKLQNEIWNLDSSIKEAGRLLKEGNHVAINAQALLSKLQSSLTLPCVAVKLDASVDTTPNLRCTFGDDLAKAVRKHGQMEGELNIGIVMKTIEEVPSDLMLVDDIESTLVSVTTPSTPLDTASITTESSTVESLDVDALSVTSETNSVLTRISGDSNRKTRKKQKLHVRSNKLQKIFVTHIKNPSHFMVIKDDDVDRLKSLQKNVAKYCASPEASKDIPKRVDIGDYVLSLFQGVWYRARVTRLLSADISDIVQNPDNFNVEVFYIDYGNTEVVTLANLRNIKPIFMKTPELVRVCSLKDIVPPDGQSEWSQNATNEFARIAGDKVLHKTTLMEIDELEYVELHKPGCADIDVDPPVSVRETLVFLELAVFTTPPTLPTPSLGILARPKKEYFPPNLPFKGTTVHRAISHAESPDNFYIQQEGDEFQYLNKMMNDIQTAYNQETGDEHTVFCPQKGMVCVAQYSVDSAWYRAQVVDLPGEKMVKVRFVDYGNEEITSHWSLRKLKDQYTVLAEQAIPCKLADVEPIDEGWSDQAVKMFCESVLYQNMQITVKSILENGTIEVFMTENLRDEELGTRLPVCCNVMMVDNGFAISTGPGSEPPNIPLLVEKPPPKPDSRPSSARKPAKDLAAFPDTSSSAFMTPDGTPTVPASQPVRKAVTIVTDKEKPPYQEVKVSCITSPGEIYMHLAKADDDLLGDQPHGKYLSLGVLMSPGCTCDAIDDHQCVADPSGSDVFSESLTSGHFAGYLRSTSRRSDNSSSDIIVVTQNKNSLMKALLKAMAETVAPDPATWVVGDFCTSRYSRCLNHNWYRAKILSITDDKAQLLLVDYGYQDCVPLKDLRTLPGAFTSAGQFSFRCHLADMQPAGDITRWTKTSIEYLTETLRDQICYIVTKGDVENGSSPVDLLIVHITPGDALTAEQVDYVSVGQMLLDKGLALPKRVRKKPLPRDLIKVEKSQSPEPVTTSTPKSSKPKLKENSVAERLARSDRKLVSESAKTIKSEDISGQQSKDIPAKKTKSEDLGGQQTEDITSESDTNTVTADPGNDSDSNAAELIESVPGTPLPDSDTCSISSFSIPDTPCGESTLQDEEPSTPERLVRPPSIGTPPPLSSPHVEPAPIPPTELLDYKPPEIPDRADLTVVPTYVDYSCHVFVQDVKPDDHPEGRLGFCLKESTIEVRLQDSYFKKMGLYRGKIIRDGNCLFRACAQALFSDQNEHRKIRDTVADAFTEFWFLFEHILGTENKEKYILKTMRDGEYGGEPEIQAICFAHQVQIHLYMGGLDSPITRRVYGNTSSAVIRLSYVSDGQFDCGHYDYVVESECEVESCDKAYSEWRAEKVEDYQMSGRDADNRKYELSILKQLMNYLDRKYSGSPPEPDAKWEVGQACVAQYGDDNKYYRARITEKVPQGYKVTYVDFGNFEILPVARLRSEVALPDIPIMCYECILDQFHAISTYGRWEVTDLDKIHGLLVGNTFTMHIKDITDGPMFVVGLTYPNTGYSVVDNLCEYGLGVSSPELADEPEDLEGDIIDGHYARKTQKVVKDIPTSADEAVADIIGMIEDMAMENVDSTVTPERTVESPYTPPKSPEVEDLLVVTVTQIDSLNLVYLQHQKQEDADEPTLASINDQLDKLLEISAFLNQKCDQFPVMKNPKTGDACCALFSVDHCWYRGEVISTGHGNKDLCGVLFVDYGSFEYLPNANLRELPADVMTLPRQSIRVHLWGLEGFKQDDENNPETKLKMAETLASVPVLVAVVKNVGEVTGKENYPKVEVDLYPQDKFYEHGKEAPLVYQPLIDQGVIKYNKHQPDSSAAIIEETYDEVVEGESPNSKLTWAEMAELEKTEEVD